MCSEAGIPWAKNCEHLVTFPPRAGGFIAKVAGLDRVVWAAIGWRKTRDCEINSGLALVGFRQLSARAVSARGAGMGGKYRKMPENSPKIPERKWGKMGKNRKKSGK